MKKVALIAAVALSLACVMVEVTIGYADDNYTVSSGNQATTKKQDGQKPSEKSEPSKDTEKSDKQKERDENYTVHKTGEGHGGVPTSGGFKP